MIQPQVAPDVLKAMLDEIWHAGGTPMLRVALPMTGLPEAVHRRWALEGSIPLELRAEYPLNLAWRGDGLEVDLAFSGAVSRCTIPWVRVVAIYDLPAQGLPQLVYTAYGGVLNREPPAPIPAHVPVSAPSGPPKLSVIRGGKG